MDRNCTASGPAGIEGIEPTMPYINIFFFWTLQRSCKMSTKSNYPGCKGCRESTLLSINWSFDSDLLGPFLSSVLLSSPSSTILFDGPCKNLTVTYQHDHDALLVRSAPPFFFSHWAKEAESKVNSTQIMHEFWRVIAAEKKKDKKEKKENSKKATKTTVQDVPGVIRFQKKKKVLHTVEW